MKNRREFLGGCVGAAVAMALPAAGLIPASAQAVATDRYGLEAFRALEGKRIGLREGGSVLVSNVEAIHSDRRCEQFVVQVVASGDLGSGLYHLQTAGGPCAVYLEAGGANRSTLTAAFSRLRV